MKSLNSVSIMGHLGRDPESKQVGNATLCTFSIALTDKYKDKNGEWVEKTNWVNVQAWNKSGETIMQYVRKGDPIFIEGSLKVDSYEKNGEKRTATSVTCKNFILLGGKSEVSREEIQAPTFEPVEEGDGSDLPF